MTTEQVKTQVTEQVTQAQIDAYNAKWRKRTEEQFAPRPVTEKSKEYWEKVNSMPDHPVKKTYTEIEAKQVFWKYLVSVIGKSGAEISEQIKQDQSYSLACKLIIDFIFDLPNETLRGKGGLYFWSNPGIGKTTLLRAAIQSAHISFNVIKNPGIVLWSSMTRDISKKIGGHEVDLTYANESHLFLDDLTEKINQVSHYGDYKYSMNEIIQNRYELWKSKGLFTFISSNIVLDDTKPLTLFSYMDGRSIDRFKEMFHVVEIYGKSKRNTYV